MADSMYCMSELASLYGVEYDNWIAYMFFGIIRKPNDIEKFISYYELKQAELKLNIAEMEEVQFYRLKNDIPDNKRLLAGWGNLKNLAAKNERLVKINHVIEDLYSKRDNIESYKKVTKDQHGGCG